MHQGKNNKDTPEVEVTCPYSATVYPSSNWMCINTCRLESRSRAAVQYSRQILVIILKIKQDSEI